MVVGVMPSRPPTTSAWTLPLSQKSSSLCDVRATRVVPPLSTNPSHGAVDYASLIADHVAFVLPEEVCECLRGLLASRSFANDQPVMGTERQVPTDEPTSCLTINCSYFNADVFRTAQRLAMVLARVGRGPDLLFAIKIWAIPRLRGCAGLMMRRMDMLRRVKDRAPRS